MEKDNATNGGQVNPEGQEIETTEAEVQTYSQEELDAKIQTEADRRVTQALETAKAKWKKEQDELIAKEKDEAAKLAKMSEAERARAEIDKEREALEKERAVFQRSRLELETVKQLAEQDLDPSFANFLMGEDADATAGNIKAFKAAFSEAVENAVKERLGGRAPKASNKEAPKKAVNMQEIANNARIIK